MSPNAAALVSVSTGAGLFLVIHLGLWRSRPSNAPRIGLLALLAGFHLLVTLAIFEWLVGFQSPLFLAVFGLYSSLIVFYVLLYGVIVRSVSISLLTRLNHAEKKAIEFDTILKEYLSSRKFDERIAVMHQAGLVILSDEGSVTLTPQGRRLVRTAAGFARVFSDRVEG